MSAVSDTSVASQESTSSQGHRPIHRLFKRYGSVSSEFDKDSSMAEEDLYPVRAALETLQVGSWRYTSRDVEEVDGEAEDCGDIQLLYEHKSSRLLIKTTIEGSKGAVPASFLVKSVSAADLSLISVVPNSLESMVVRMVLETDETITYTPSKGATKKGATETAMETVKGAMETVNGAMETDNGATETDNGATETDNGATEINEGAMEGVGTSGKKDSRELNISIIRITASVHETGRLRDILHFQNSPCDLSPGCSSCEESLAESKPAHLSLLEGLPFWVLYMPWTIYSKKTRRFLQTLLLLYTFLSVMWALWQLYRHVNVIRVVIQPVIVALRYYLTSVVELFDSAFALFTVWWHTLLSPLNVLQGLLLAPILKLVTEFKWIFSPMYNLLHSSGLLSVLASLLSTFVVVARLAGLVLWTMLQVLLRPLGYIWQSVPNVRVAMKTLDFQRRLVFGLLWSSVRSIARGLLTFVGYTRKEKKIKKAMASAPVVSPISSPSNTSVRHRSDRSSMPMIYRSPLSKQN